MHEIDVEELVMRSLVAVVPEPGRRSLVDAGAGDDDTGHAPAEFVREDVEEALELVPGCHVGFLEENFRARAELGGLEPLCRLAVERYVADENGAALGVDGFCEGEVDTCVEVLSTRVDKLLGRKRIGDRFDLVT